MDASSINDNNLNDLTKPIDLAALVQPVSFRSHSFSMLRLDKMASWASGNKYFKLKPYISDAIANQSTRLVSKGGMFSNHLEALAKAGKHFDLDVTCIVRSHQPDLQNPTIQQLSQSGAEVRFLMPADFATYDDSCAAEEYPGSVFIPEGGLSKSGISGSESLGQMIDKFDFDHIVLMAGTMCTALGLMSTLSSSKTVYIIPAWKGCTSAYVTQLINQYDINASAPWELWADYHFGGFGKWNAHLLESMHEFTEATGIPLDPVYTGKMVFAFLDQLSRSTAIDPSRALLIHTGGLQGVAGYAYRFPQAWKRYYFIT
jgi:1-aminocyclopropane-1-carboxylate deaminase